MSNKEQNSEELNKIMQANVQKQEILSDDEDDTNNVQLEESYQQMNLIMRRRGKKNCVKNLKFCRRL